MNKIVRKLLCVLVCAFLAGSSSATANREISIIPQPTSVKPVNGIFILDNSVSINNLTKNVEVNGSVDWLIKKIARSSGITLKQGKGKKVITVELGGQYASLGKEGYKLKVLPSGITVSAFTPTGIFYAFQSLLQLFPPEVESTTLKQGVKWELPCADIEDQPRFGYRGLMLDVSRHFFTKEEVKSYIDEMARYKYNTLHWHLNDDEGWRLEIKGLPKLTSVGAWRVNRTGHWSKNFMPQLEGEVPTYGGFYTQEDVKEIVAYAQTRSVTIIPEIDVPGHSLALIAAYPNLSCTQLPYTVNGGRPFYTKDDNALCVGNDSIFAALDIIFKEVAALFPSEYIHVGCDEAYKGFWKKCAKCQNRIREEKLKDEDELQSYFVKRIGKSLQANGKKFIGWDEILEGGIAPDAIVMSYRGTAGGIAAAKMNHEVIMTPAGETYLNFYQGEPNAEPPAQEAMCRISDSYHFNPVPRGVDKKYILGGQACLWTEHIPTYRHLQYMMWPRALALSEVYWSEHENKNWENFIRKTEHHFLRLDAADIKYATSMYNVIFKSKRLNDYEFSFTMSTEVQGLDIYYTFDETNPDHYSAKYTGEPIRFPEGATTVKVIAYRNGKPIGTQINMSKKDLWKRS